MEIGVMDMMMIAGKVVQISRCVCHQNPANVQGVFFTKKFKFGKPRLGESTLTYRVFFLTGTPLKS